MSLTVACHQPNYLPWLGYFDKMAKADVFVYLDDVQMLRGRGWENRNRVRRGEDWIWLTVPVKRKGRGLQALNMVEIDHATSWIDKHLESLRHAYSRTPFFESHRQALEQIYAARPDRLVDLNLALIEYGRAQWGLTGRVVLSSSLGVTTTGSARLMNIVAGLGGDTYLSGGGDDGYLDPGLFSAEGVGVLKQNFQHPSYPQHGHDAFLSGLAFLDALFNLGPRVSSLLGKTPS